MITIRRYQVGDEPKLWQLFFHTVRHISIRDYSTEQVEAWAPDNFDAEVWKQKIRALNPFVAEIDGDIVGYTDLQPDGLIDHFFCHHQHQGKGVGRALMNALFEEGDKQGISRYYSHVSITAKPFFEAMGFKVMAEQKIEVRGALLQNYIMETQSA